MKRYLTDFPYWDKLSEQEKQLVASSAVTKKYSKGESIHSCDKNCLGMVYIISGKIKLYLLSDEGKEVTLFYLGKGETCVLAASCVLSHITFQSELSAAEDTELLIVPASVFSKLINNNIYVRCYTYELSAKRFSDVMWTMQQILFLSLDKRLATYLIAETEKQNTTTLKLTQEQIAMDINSAREAVARMLKQFSADGLVESKRGLIIIKDINGLKNIL